MKQVTIHTDGACSGNPGPGGYAAILVYNGREKVISGGEPDTTNNRMELLAVINSLSALNERCDVTLHSDSKYVIDAVTQGWAERWRRNGWMRTKKDRAQNPELWERLLELLKTQNVTFQWVRGHNGDEYNERCDRIAVEESRKAAGRGD